MWDEITCPFPNFNEIMWNIDWYSNIFNEEKAIDNIAYKKIAILPRDQWVTNLVYLL